MTPGPRASVEVRFVVMPFLPEHQPALGVSSLLGVLRAHGISADARYLNLAYRAHVGADVYAYLSRQFPSVLLGELIFTPALWGAAAPRWEEFDERLLRGIERAEQRAVVGSTWQAELGAIRTEWRRRAPHLRELYEHSHTFVRQWAQEILEGTPRVVGFTSTFQQNIASLALARELRRLTPRGRLLIVMGGANCEGDMGAAIADNFPFLDHVVSGEAENLILDLVEVARGAKTASDVAGVPVPRVLVGPIVPDLNELPRPIFDDYFDTIVETDLMQTANLVAESSRGCWWGMTSHCIFCGLNGNTMAFRSKDATRFAGEIRSAVQRFGNRPFLMADNILDMGYLRTLLPEFAANGEEFRFFYETKSNLKKSHIELMAAAGVRVIQPGIESLSTPVLQLMGKGTTRLQNVQLLKWCEELAVEPIWNLLYGVPGEPVEEYRSMAALIPSLCHLPPPGAVTQIRLDRFSPLWHDPARHGIQNVHHHWSFDCAYAPLTPAQRARLAYFFEFEYEDGRAPAQYAGDLVEQVVRWRAASARRAVLERCATDGDHYVIDSRAGAEARRWRLAPAMGRLLTVLDVACDRRAALAALNRDAPAGEVLSPNEFAELLQRARDREWIIEEDRRLLSVVVDRSERQRVDRRRVNLQLERLGLPALVE
jgi:ribosomal peptide maturation radical SAM protein 1